jgi:hypothetical protein
MAARDPMRLFGDETELFAEWPPARFDFVALGNRKERPGPNWLDEPNDLA